MGYVSLPEGKHDPKADPTKTMPGTHLNDRRGIFTSKSSVSWLCFLPEKNNPTVGCPVGSVRIKGDRMSVG